MKNRENAPELVIVKMFAVKPLSFLFPALGRKGVGEGYESVWKFIQMESAPKVADLPVPMRFSRFSAYFHSAKHHYKTLLKNHLKSCH